MGLGVIGTDAQGCLEMQHRLAEFVLLRERTAQAMVGHGIVPGDAQGVPEEGLVAGPIIQLPRRAGEAGDQGNDCDGRGRGAGQTPIQP